MTAMHVNVRRHRGVIILSSQKMPELPRHKIHCFSRTGTFRPARCPYHQSKALRRRNDPTAGDLVSANGHIESGDTYKLLSVRDLAVHKGLRQDICTSSASAVVDTFTMSVFKI